MDPVVTLSAAQTLDGLILVIGFLAGLITILYLIQLCCSAIEAVHDAAAPLTNENFYGAVVEAAGDSSTKKKVK